MPIATPTISVSDNADGSGGVATISNGDGGASNEVFVQAVGGELGSAAWTSAGSRVGNGTVTLSVDAGFYWVKVEASSVGESLTSNLVYIHFTDGEQAVLHRCLVATQARIQSLSLAGIPNERVVVLKTADDRNIAKPAVVIAPFQKETLNPADGTNNRDDVGYPVFVAALDADNQSQTSHHDRNLLWREQIRRVFHHQRLPGVAEIINAVVEPLSIVDSQAWFDRNTYVSAMIVRFTAREPRGF